MSGASKRIQAYSLMISSPSPAVQRVRRSMQHELAAGHFADVLVALLEELERATNP